MRLEECPAGYQLVNSVGGGSGVVFAQGAQQCLRCGEEQYILNYTDACHQCPVGARCTAGALHSRVPGS
eukprot:265493-Rhodomonas_salina.1